MNPRTEYTLSPTEFDQWTHKDETARAIIRQRAKDLAAVRGMLESLPIVSASGKVLEGSVRL